jgi:NSS family neurotransmitter:Na+ symporter
MGKKDGFTSRWGFILAAMGAAIGTGNIWRFPREAALNGGGAFMIAWLVALFCWSIPILIAEYSIGKKTRMGVIGSFKKFMGKRFAWMGIWMVWVQAAIMFYYAVVMGWTLRYAVLAGGTFTGVGTQMTATNTQALWDDFINSPGEIIIWQIIAIAISAYIVSRGIKKGIEVTNKILIPLLIILLIVAMLWSLTLKGAVVGLQYLYVPKTEYLLRPETWISAITHSAWSCSAGMGMGITYASYMRKREDTTLNAFITGLGNNSVELISGVAVLGTLFAVSASTGAAMEGIEAGGSGLTFVYLSALFVRMPGGALVAVLFFAAMAFAALTSMISGIEIIVRNFIDLGWTRKKAMVYVLAAMFIMGIPSALWLTVLDNQDFVWGTGLILSGLFVSMAVIKFGANRFRTQLVNTEDSDLHIGKWWEYILKYMVPLLTIIFLGWFLLQKVFEDPANWWNPVVEQSAATLVFQWVLVFILIWAFNNNISDRFKVTYFKRDAGIKPPDIDQPFYIKDGSGMALGLLARFAGKVKKGLRLLFSKR